jgi:molecular chaperone GrpE (heat shock protein)
MAVDSTPEEDEIISASNSNEVTENTQGNPDISDAAATDLNVNNNVVESKNVADDDSTDVTEEVEIEVEPTIEELLQMANIRADKAEKEIGYRDAEIQNVRKRMLGEKADAVKYANMGFARRMLGVLGDVDRALTTVPDDENGPVVDGLRLLRNKLWQELQSSGVKKIESIGKEFNPNEHEAITTIPASDNYAAGAIIDVLEEGYMYNGRLIRAARVVVAAE